MLHCLTTGLGTWANSTQASNPLDFLETKRCIWKLSQLGTPLDWNSLETSERFQFGVVLHPIMILVQECIVEQFPLFLEWVGGLG